MSTQDPMSPQRGQTAALSLVGLDAQRVQIEATLASTPGTFLLAGLTEPQARETRVRVRAALQQIGVEVFHRGITVQLNPEPIRMGGALDVAIALAVLGALGEHPLDALRNTVVLGELSLTGAIRPLRGVLPMLLGAVAQGITRAIVPRANAREAASVPA